MPQTHPPPGAIVLSDARRGGAIADPRTCLGIYTWPTFRRFQNGKR